MRDIINLLFGIKYPLYIRPFFTVSFYLMIIIVIKFFIIFFVFRNIKKKIENILKNKLSIECIETKHFLKFIMEKVLKIKDLLNENIENRFYYIKTEIQYLKSYISNKYLKQRNFYLGVIFISIFILLLASLFELIEVSYLYLNKEDVLPSSLSFMKVVMDKLYYNIFPLCIYTIINCFLSSLFIINIRKKISIFQIKIDELCSKIVLTDELPKESESKS